MRIMSYILTALALLIAIGGLVRTSGMRAESAIQEAAISAFLANHVLGGIFFLLAAIVATLRANDAKRTEEHQELVLTLSSLKNKTTGGNDSLAAAKARQDAEISAMTGKRG